MRHVLGSCTSPGPPVVGAASRAPFHGLARDDPCSHLRPTLAGSSHERLGSRSSRLTVTQWLIVSLAAIGFAFDIYELLMMQFIMQGRRSSS